MNITTGNIFDIKRYSIHDGPGIRTTVFFKGCSLSCGWCHNPESVDMAKELMHWIERCIGCEKCLSICPNRAVSINNELVVTNRNKCRACGVCVKQCPLNARQIVGKEVSVDNIIKEIEKDTIFYDESGGGVTISGGEPFLQPEFLNKILVACKDKEIHTAVDTSGYTKTEDIMKISEKIDLFLYDIKMIDDEKHKKYTGISNKLIIENLRKLNSLGKRIIVRFPLIPGINSNREDICTIGDFVSQLKSIEELDILPHHQGGFEKAKRIGWKNVFKVDSPSDEMVENVANELGRFGIKIKIGG